MSELGFVAPATIDGALAELAAGGALALAGGTSVALLLKNQLTETDRLVYLGHIPDLAGIRPESGRLRIGATVTLRELAVAPSVRAGLPALAEAAGKVGNPRIRAVATVGGGVIHGDPRQDLPPVLLAAGASVRLVSKRGTREMELGRFLRGFFETAIEPDELLTDVLVPLDPAVRCRYTRFNAGSEDDYPTVTVAVSWRLRGDGAVTAARVVVGGAAPTVQLAAGAATLLEGAVPSPGLIARVAASAAAGCTPSGGGSSPAGYKRAMVEVWVRRALTALSADGGVTGSATRG